MENLLAFPRFVAKAVLLIASRQTNRCKQTKQGETSALRPSASLLQVRSQEHLAGGEQVPFTRSGQLSAAELISGACRSIDLTR